MILVFIQQLDGNVPKSSLSAISAALQLKSALNASSVCGVVLGKNARSAADAAATMGLSKIYFSEEDHLASYFAPQYVKALIAAADSSGCHSVITTATSTGKDLMPRFAALWDAGQASDVVAIHADGSLRRPMYAGDIFADVALTTAKKVITVRGSSFAPPSSNGSPCEIVALVTPREEGNFGAVLSHQVAKAERPELADASVVVSGGRALQSSENFEKVIFPLADALHAAVGASRAAVDSGYAPNDWQVGQTGKIVAPDLYIAVGISGAIQHLAGMKDSKVIVAINKDAEAPIFEVADYSLVADLFEAVPALTEEIAKVKGK